MTEHHSWLPFDVLDFWGSRRVLQMSNDAVLMYLALLSEEWIHGPLPADPALIERVVPSGRWPDFRKVWNELLALGCFELTANSSGGWINRRLEGCRVGGRWATFSHVQAERGRKGGHAKAAKASGIAGQAGRPERKSPSRPGWPLTGQDRTGQDRTEDKNSPEGAVPAGPAKRRAPPKDQTRPGTPQAELVEWWQAAWKERRGSEYTPQRKDFVTAVRLLKLAALPEVKARALSLLESRDAFHLKAADLPLLLSCWNKLAGRQNGFFRDPANPDDAPHLDEAAYRQALEWKADLDAGGERARALLERRAGYGNTRARVDEMIAKGLARKPK